MHVFFTDKEKDNLIIKDFKMTIKKDCPNDIKKTLEKKIQKIREYEKEIKNI